LSTPDNVCLSFIEKRASSSLAVLSAPPPHSTAGVFAERRGNRERQTSEGLGDPSPTGPTPQSPLPYEGHSAEWRRLYDRPFGADSRTFRALTVEPRCTGLRRRQGVGALTSNIRRRGRGTLGRCWVGWNGGDCGRDGSAERLWASEWERRCARDESKTVKAGQGTIPRPSWTVLDRLWPSYSRVVSRGGGGRGRNFQPEPSNRSEPNQPSAQSAAGSETSPRMTLRSQVPHVAGQEPVAEVKTDRWPPGAQDQSSISSG